MNDREKTIKNDGEDTVKRKFISARYKDNGKIKSALRNTERCEKTETPGKLKPKHLISVSDLLQLRRQSYSHLFPLVDFQTYQTRAQASIYNTDELLPNEEMLPYFGSPPNQVVMYNGISRRGSEVPATPSDEVFYDSSAEVINGIPSDQTEHLITEDGDATFLDKLYSRCSQYMRREHTITSMLLRRRSTPLLVMETVNSSLPDLPPRAANPRNVWVGCIIDYMVITRRLNIRLVHTCALFETFFGGKLFAKVFLLPGQIQKKKVSVKAYDCKSHKRISFEKFSGPELHRMEIGVRLMLGKGLLKKSQVLGEWTIPLDQVSLICENTAWQLFEWRK